MQIYSKNNKNCFFSLISWPIFILFVLSDRARWRLQNLYTKFWNSLIMLIYANLRSPGRDPGVQSALKKKNLLLLLFFIFFHVPSGASNLYFSHSNFFIFSPFPGHQIFIFWPVENCTTRNLRYLMLRDAGWALRHWRFCFNLLSFTTPLRLDSRKQTVEKQKKNWVYSLSWFLFIIRHIPDQVFKMSFVESLPSQWTNDSLSKKKAHLSHKIVSCLFFFLHSVCSLL